jgi:hypothetical protein
MGYLISAGEPLAQKPNTMINLSSQQTVKMALHCYYYHHTLALFVSLVHVRAGERGARGTRNPRVLTQEEYYFSTKPVWTWPVADLG